MARNYTEQERIDALARIEANGGNVEGTSREIGIPASVLRRWKRRYLAAFDNGPGAASIENVHQQLLKHAVALVASLAEGMDDAPINQRATALNQMMATILKLSSALQGDEQEQVIRIEYQDPDGTVHQSPPWARGGAEVESAVQGSGGGTPVREVRDREAADA